MLLIDHDDNNQTVIECSDISIHTNICSIGFGKNINYLVHTYTVIDLASAVQAVMICYQ